jgi:hypothetical protein
MIFKALFFRSPARADQVGAARPVISSYALREAALRASWHRDHQVARRREAWRWLMFWSWKYGRKPVLALAGLGMLWWGTRLLLPDSPVPQWPQPTQLRPSTPVPTTAQVAPSVEILTHAAPSSQPTDLGLTAALALPGPQRITNASSPATDAPLQPLQLKSEFQLAPSPLSNVPELPVSSQPHKGLPP